MAELPNFRPVVLNLFFFYLILILVVILIPTVSLHLRKLFGYYYFPFTFVDEFYCYLVGVRKKMCP